jgi:hypothetical protein
MHELKKLIGNVTNQLYGSAAIRCLMLAVSAFLLLSVFAEHQYLLPLSGAFVGLVGGTWLTGILKNKKPEAISLIHKYVGETEYSLHILEKDQLNIAEQLQLERIFSKTIQFPYTKLYTGMRWYMVMVVVSAAFYFFYPKIQNDPEKAFTSTLPSSESVKSNPLTAPSFQASNVTINPPAYTKLPVRKQTDLNISSIAGSGLHWNVRLSHDSDVSVKLANNRGEEVLFKKQNGSFHYQDRLAGSGLYTIKAFWRDSLIYQSDFYRLEALPDLAPKIEPTSKELYQYHFLKDNKTVQISAKISDDFQVRQVFIVATLARGTGENVKFREVKFPLLPTDFKQANLKKTINLTELNFAPGDELYYYWAAIDNRQPEANFSKSDTYFIVYKDTSQIEEAELATMAVNIMPEYFRSQRQIIIDTEKLIVKKKKLPVKEFNSVSNEIGFDQKVLRLRYGQYLGEEFETSIGGGGLPAGTDQAPSGAGIVDAFTHKSDGEGEAAERRATEPAKVEGHDHAHEKEENSSKDPLAALMEQYTHSHDDAETNTFYEQSTRSLLKMALEQMWQSELHLRMYEPEKALPFEHKALEYLKSAQHKARTFVKKSGYDPPPIKEKEKRLTGELKDVSSDFNSKISFDQKRTQQLAAELLGFLDYNQPNKNQQAKLQMLGAELSERLINSGPVNGGLLNWAVIASLQKLVAGKTLAPGEKLRLKNELYQRAAPALQTRAGYAGNKKLEAAFRKKLR